jgi:acetylornithine/succinyldiaminopimelate/putrescine aminotransferase
MTTTPPAATAPPATPPRPSIAATCRRLVEERVPNFFRPWANPLVAATCACLAEDVRAAWPARGEGSQVFLANSFEEALGGAVKLARFCASLLGRPAAGVALDPDGRLEGFASLELGERGRIDFIPGLLVAREEAALEAARGPARPGFLVLAGAEARAGAGVRALLREARPLVVACLDRAALDAVRLGRAGLLGEVVPDVVVFDESFVNREVPFGAFAARRSLYAHWNRGDKATFHSTTFQPNAIASAHFLACLAAADPARQAALAPLLERLRGDPAATLELLHDVTSPSLARTVRALGFDAAPVRAQGHYVEVGARRVFDAVAGVACSIRGHNPASYPDEVERIAREPDLRPRLAERLARLTGLAHFAPAVSGASAVENALRIALAAQFPRRVVLAFEGGFGGKTPLALAGTARPALKERLAPLYPHVVYVDPFAPDARARIAGVLAAEPVAVVEVELVQGVGGVRRIPAPVLDLLASERRRAGYLLFVDEVQTGMFRTGPFALSREWGLEPDLLAVGKGVSDMMFPFALTLYSEAVSRGLAGAPAAFRERLARRYEYALGYATVLNALEQAEALGLEGRVRARGAELERRLAALLGGCRAVREVRAHGLLVGIELEARGLAGRLLGKSLGPAHLVRLARGATFPVLAGNCQYEPNVLKLTPPLTITAEEVGALASAIAEALRSPLPRVLAGAVGALWRSRASRVRRRGGAVFMGSEERHVHG